MASPALVEALVNSLSNSATERLTAEQFLRKCELCPGYLGSLLAVVKEPSAELGLRVTAAITLKNQIRMHWVTFTKMSFDVQIEASAKEGSMATRTYEESEKQMVRNQILAIYTELPIDLPQLRRQVEEAIKWIIVHDFPDQWSQLGGAVIEAIQQRENVTMLISGLSILRRICGKFELLKSDQETDMTRLNQIADAVLPLLLKCGNDIGLHNLFVNKESSYIVKMVCKIYYVLSNIGLVESEALVSTLDGYMGFLKQVIVTPIPADQQGDDSYAMKAKKWSLQTLRRFFSRFATSKTKLASSSAEATLIAKPFAERWALPLLECLLAVQRQLIEMRSKVDKEDRLGDNDPTTAFLSLRLQAILLEYFMNALQLAGAYQVIKPHLEFIIVEVIHPWLCYDQEDCDLWESDPMDFLRKASDFFEQCNSPREAASGLLRAIMRLRGKDFLAPVATFCEGILKEYQQLADGLKGPMTYASRRKDGALHMIGVFAERICGKKRKAELENIMRMYMLPDLMYPAGSGDKFLKRRVCLTLERLLNDEYSVMAKTGVFSDPGLMVQLLDAILNNCIVHSEELPVRIAGITAIGSFFSIPHEGLRSYVKQNLLAVLDKILNVLEIAEYDTVVTTLDILISYFAEDIPVHSERIIATLIDTLVKLMMKSNEATENAVNGTPDSSPSSLGGGLDDENSTFTIMVICRTISTILTALSDVKFNGLILQLLPKFDVFFDTMLRPDCLDYMDDVMECLAMVTFYVPTPVGPSGSPQYPSALWKYYERMYQAVCGGRTHHYDQLSTVFSAGWAVDELRSMVAVLDNYLNRDQETFVNGSTTIGIYNEESGQWVPVSKTYQQMYYELTMKALKSYDVEPDAPAFAVPMVWILVDNFVDRLTLVDRLVVQLVEEVWAFVRRPPQPISKSMKTFLNKTMLTLAYADMPAALTLCQKLNIVDEVAGPGGLWLDTTLLTTNDSRKIWLLTMMKIIRTIQREAMGGSPPSEGTAAGPVITNILPAVYREGAQELLVDIATVTVEFMKHMGDDDDDDDQVVDLDSEQELSENEDAQCFSLFNQKLMENLKKAQAAADDDDDDEEYGIEVDQLGNRMSPLDAVVELAVAQNFFRDFSREMSAAVGANDMTTLVQKIDVELSNREAKRLAGGVATA